jgi:hypothetical protein
MYTEAWWRGVLLLLTRDGFGSPCILQKLHAPNEILLARMSAEVDSGSPAVKFHSSCRLCSVLTPFRKFRVDSVFRRHWTAWTATDGTAGTWWSERSQRQACWGGVHVGSVSGKRVWKKSSVKDELPYIVTL